MQLSILRDDTLIISGARILFRNFEGKPDKYNPKGDRTFSLSIPDREIADRLIRNKNRFGAGWNVRVRPPRNPDEDELIHMQIKLRFNDFGGSIRPDIRLISGDNQPVRITPENAHILDKISIDYVEMSVRPYDGDDGPKGPYRSAWLNEMIVHQKVSWIEKRLSEMEAPEESADDDRLPF